MASGSNVKKGTKGGGKGKKAGTGKQSAAKARDKARKNLLKMASQGDAPF